MKTKLLSVILAFAVVIGMFTAIPFSVSVTAQEADIVSTGSSITQAEAVAWANSQVGKALDYDGAYGAQCVDLILYYYAYLGDGVVGGNGKDFAWNKLPSGWVRTDSPQQGDIAVWTSGDYGHVAIVTELRGSQMVCVEQNYAGKQYVTPNLHSINAQTYIRPNFANPTPVNNPIGYLDIAESLSAGTIHVKGWAFDWDNTGAALSIHIYVGGPAGSGAPSYAITANKERTDVNDVNPGAGNYHGFDDTITVSKSGNQPIYAYAINIGSGNDNPNLTLSPKTVNIIADTIKPVCEKTYVSLINPDGFRVCAVVKDNVGVKSVSVATWTQADQSDLQWHDAYFNGTDTYFYGVNRADFSAIQNSYYFNHFYIYDYAGNLTVASCPQDYKIVSDTGKIVPEGEYRIVTAVNENRALDVADASKDNGTNIMIYNNFASKKETFVLSYLDNGFYTISNSYSELVLDVQGDTYINNSNVMQHTANGGPNQEWMFKSSGDGYYYIISRTNGLALDVTNAEDRDGANVAVHTQNQSTAQKWKLRRVLNDDMVAVKDVIVKSETDTVNPEITVTVDGNAIERDGNYQVEVEADIASGKGTVTVTGLDYFCDSVTKEFNITVDPTDRILGDADGNGDVDAVDATIVQRVATNIAVQSDEAQLMCADVDEDDSLTVVDATFIQRHCTHIKTPYPIGEPI